MTLVSKFGTAAILSAAILLFGAGSPCLAQSIPSPYDAHVLTTYGPNPVVTPDPVTTEQPTAAAADLAPSGSPQVGLPPEDSGWHFAVSPYYGFPECTEPSDRSGAT
jgi:hypothetical protein